MQMLLPRNSFHFAVILIFRGIRALFLKPANDRVRCINKKILLQAVRDLQEICFINIKELAGSVELLSELRLLSCSLILVHKTL